MNTNHVCITLFAGLDSQIIIGDIIPFKYGHLRCKMNQARELMSIFHLKLCFGMQQCKGIVTNLGYFIYVDK